jgi:hypothetical protein
MEAFEHRMTNTQKPVRKQFLSSVGAEVWVREWDFEIIAEPWSRYRLLDSGMEVRNRAVVTKIYQLMDQDPNDPNKFTPRLAPNGDPFISVDANPMLATSY